MGVISVTNKFKCIRIIENVCIASLVHGLLDEVMNSAVNRCIEPHLMEPSVRSFDENIFTDP